MERKSEKSALVVCGALGKIMQMIMNIQHKSLLSCQQMQLGIQPIKGK